MNIEEYYMYEAENLDGWPVDGQLLKSNGKAYIITHLRNIFERDNDLIGINELISDRFVEVKPSSVRRVAMKPIPHYDKKNYCCPNCRALVTQDRGYRLRFNHCTDCGMAIDRSGEDDEC